MKTFEVVATLKFPAYGDVTLSEQFYATDRNAALKKAREWMRDVMGYTRQDGPVKYKAKVVVE